MKITAISYITQFGCDICKDAGESSVGDKVELAGRILIEEMNLLKKPFTAIVEVDDFANNVLYNHNVGFFKWLKQCFTADCHYYFDRQDWKPLFFFILRSIICKLKKNK